MDGAAAARSAWVLSRDAAQAAALAHALEGAGWRVTARGSSLAEVHERLAEAPQVIVTGLRYDDGDALQLIRTLARHAAPSALFIASGQQRAVIQAAVALARACGISIAGVAEQPLQPGDLARRLCSLVATPPAPPPAAVAPLPRADLLDLLDRGAVQPFLQPKVRLDSAEVVGFEALMRGHDADGRLIMPDRLVGALREHGLLDRATLHLARCTVEFVARCLGEAMPVSASVNVSMASLSSLAFCQALERIAAHAGLDPSWITIEITETDAMADVATVIENTARIRMLGFNLSIDDFGTAHSSLTQLSQLPFSELKIERAFVAGIDADARKQAIVGACAGLGDALGLNVVAEGVQTPQELQTVRRLGCTEVQGWLVSRPLPAADALAWLRRLPPELRVPLPPSG